MQNNNLSKLISIIEDKSNVSDIISDYISLEKKGNNHVGLCPFHSDSNPSMSVSDNKGIFKCFVCGAGGSAISFVQNYEGISFIEAVKRVADKLKIDWKEYISQREIKIDPEVKRGWEINEEALNFFKYTLNNTVDNKVKDYIESRGINQEIIDKFDIGYSGEGLASFLLNKDFTEEEIIKYGLAKRREDTTLQDYFFNRLIFTIKNADGKVVGFSGRVLEDSNYAKYMNSPENPVFKKSNILYNLDKAKISANLKKKLIVVEGFMDVIALHKAGIDNAIATMGTAFTKEHNKILKSITSNIVLAFDSDVAGINASITTAKTLIQDGFHVDHVNVPNGKDFDELLKSGAEAVERTLKDKKEFLSFYKEMIYKKLDSQGSDLSFEVLRELLKVISYYNDNLKTDVNLNEISNKYGISREILNEEFSKFKVVEKTPYLDDYIPEQVIQKDNSLKKTLNKITVGDNRNPQKLWLNLAEETIVSYAIMEGYAFDYLMDHPMTIFYNKEIYDLWKAFVKNKLNSEPITDEVISSRIESLLLKTKNEINTSELVDITNRESYKQYIQKYMDELNDYNRKQLKYAIEAENDFEEKEHLLKMLQKLV